MHRVIGGIETHCRHLYPALARACPSFRITVYERSGYHHAVPEDDAYTENLEIRMLWAPHLKAAEAFFHTLFAIIAARFRVNSDVLHIHSIGPGIWTPLARILGMRVIVTIHARDYERPKWGVIIANLLRFGEYLSCRFAHAVVCVSQATLIDVKNRYPQFASRFYVIPHGAEPLPPPLPDKGAEIFDTLCIKPGGYILAVGRFDKIKRFQDLVDARARLGPEALPLVIVGWAVGESEESSGMRNLRSSGVILAGPRFGQELNRLYRNASLFIHPSQMEGFGLVVLEALSAEVPMALSDLPQHREFGLPDNCYFPVGDIDAIARLMALPDHAQFMPDPGQWLIAQFAIDQMIAKYETLFRQIASAD